jgi:single-strand DNA-binding protein
MNKVLLIGNCGSKPELRYTQNGTAVLSPSIAVTKSYKDSQGQQVKTTTWVNVVVYGKRAEWASQDLQKGTKVFVDGELNIRDYQAKDGTKKTVVEVIAFQFVPFTAKKDAQSQSYAPPMATFDMGTMSEEDIPF